MENGNKEAKEVTAEEKQDVAPEKPLDETKSQNEGKKETMDIEEEKIEEEAEKPDETPEEVTPELLQKIKSQVEFYFGDVNMARDRFLIEQGKLDEGWIPMSIMLKFKALASLSQNVETILKAIEDSELMEISENRKQIRRSTDKPLPVYDEAYKQAQSERTVYCKGFPKEGKMTVQVLKDFFKDFEPNENIVVRRWTDKKTKEQFFKGSIFVQFTTLDGAKAFMARDSVKYEDTELIRMFLSDYLAEKAKERGEGRSSKKDGKAKSNEKEGDSVEAEETEDVSGFPKGAVLGFKEADENVNRETIKKAISNISYNFSDQIAYVDYEKGNKDGLIRFQGEGTAQKLLKKLEGSRLTLGDCKLECWVLEGEEEERYLKKVKEQMLQKKQQIKNSKRGRAKRGRGGSPRGGKRRGSPTRDTPPEKTVKTS
ncbi:la protein homolog [Fopius arisanus]|uniref:La protein homolog n=2 Tax=Fopius arisanus TaxID=64838 RepID=A0A9R1T7A0_9HYME|nr:PREDICTED: la protein homolog [Fopius arisanus]